MNLKTLAGGAALTALSLAFAGAAYAQETTSAIRGEVTDVNGGPISGAEVVVTHMPTGTRTSEATDASGIFDMRGLRVGGPYTIEVSASDHQGERVEDVFITVGQPYRVVVDLETSEEEIVVTAQSVGGTRATGSNTVLSRDAIDAAVSVTRDIRDLARRDPLVSQHAGGIGGVSNSGISIAGSNPRANRITIDGVQAQDDFGLNTGGLPTLRGPISLDAVRQFSIEAAPFDVENGDFLGGSISVVLREGSNEFDGSAFVNYLNEGLVGTRIAGTPVKVPVTQENWGGTLRGPIVPERLFFALSYETYTSADATNFGPANAGFASPIIGPTGGPMTQAQIDAVTDVFANNYGSSFPFGAITNSKPVTDEKYTGRFDWNITDDHRATLTYRYSESGLFVRTNINATSAGLDSQWYLTGEQDETLSLQVNSDWTSKLSTEFRYSQRDYTRLQEPPAGQAFADIRVCSTQTSLDGVGQANPSLNCRLGSQTVGVVRFGPDQFRHANFLETGNDQAQFSAEYQLGAHLLKVGAQRQHTDIFNIFLPNSDGTYYFDSIADFQAGLASELIYRNAISGEPTDAAAIFGYDVSTLLAQDNWDVTDRLTLNYGLRYDYYSVEDKPVLNPNFSTRFPGLTNQETYDGRDVIMPRASFTYDWTDDLRLSGGVGLFSGGLPDVFLSNVFSNTGIIDNTVTFQRVGGVISETTGTVNCVTTPTICSDALNVVVGSGFGGSIPASVQAALGAAPVASEVNSISPDFEIPSDWKANISAGWDFAPGWRLGFDAVGLRTQDGLAFRDLRAQRLMINGVQARTPDGRLRYDGLNNTQRASVSGVAAVPSNIPVEPSGANAGRISSNRDIEAFNPDAQPFSWIVSVSLQKEWENGVDAGLSYTYQDLEEFSSSARFSSTASSLYGTQFASLDPNTATEGRSQEEIEHNFKYNFGWRHNFVGELETRFTLFGELREGRPVSFTMSGGAGRNATFGVNRGGQLAYVPDLSGNQIVLGPGRVGLSSDPFVAFDNTDTRTNGGPTGNPNGVADVIEDLQRVVDQFDIPQGGIVPRGSFTNPDIHQADLQISQELPGLFRGHRARLTFDIGNVLNLIDDEWGVVEEYPEDVRIFNVSCAGATGLADNAGVVNCNTYLISGVNTTQTRTRTTDESRWFMQIGLRYEF